MEKPIVPEYEVFSRLSIPKRHEILNEIVTPIDSAFADLNYGGWGYRHKAREIYRSASLFLNRVTNSRSAPEVRRHAEVLLESVRNAYGTAYANAFMDA